MSISSILIIAWGVIALGLWRASGRFWECDNWTWGMFVLWLLFTTALAILWPILLIARAGPDPEQLVRRLAGEDKKKKLARIERERKTADQILDDD